MNIFNNNDTAIRTCFEIRQFFFYLPLEAIQTSIFETKTDFFTADYLADKLLENVDEFKI